MFRKICTFLYFILIISKVNPEDQEENIVPEQEFVDNIEIHFKENIDFRGVEYFSNISNSFKNEENANIPTIHDIYENPNFQNIVEGILKIVPKISFEILYGETVEDNQKSEFLNMFFNTENIIKFIDEYKLNQGQTIKLCPRTEIVKRSFYKLFISIFRTTIEILFDRETSDTFADRYLKKENFDKIWKNFEEKVNFESQKKICNINSSEKEKFFLPNKPSDPIDITNNIISMSSEKCFESVDMDEDKNETVIWNRLNFGFEMEYDDINSPNDYFVGVAFGKNTINNFGQYIVYYDNWGYMGYQPFGNDINGKQRLRIFYVSLGNEFTVINKKNCETTENSVYCVIVYTYIKPDRVYYLRNIYNSESMVYTGYFIDPYKKNIITIGSIQINNKKLIESSKNRYGFIGSFLNYKENYSCCVLTSVDIFVVCPFGYGITCKDGEINESERNCENINSKKLSTNIEYDNKQYITKAFYIHKGYT